MMDRMAIKYQTKGRTLGVFFSRHTHTHTEKRNNNDDNNEYKRINIRAYRGIQRDRRILLQKLM